MNLLRLGTARHSLFAVHDPAAPGTVAARAVVICGPTGAELVFAHRSLRHLALRLARRGFDVLRFDYFGTGDSGGEAADATPAGMIRDVEFAMEAARDIAGARRVTLVGLRDGGRIASLAAARQPRDFDALVLWDPVDAAAVPPELQERSLVVATQPSSAPGGAEFIEAPCCWAESITTSGALPVAVFRRIEEWLT